MLETEKFYSELGKSYKPGIITQIVLAAFDLAKQGKKLISLTGGMYDPQSLPHKQVNSILSDATTEDWREMLQYGGTMGTLGLRQELSKFMAGHEIKSDPNGEIMITTGSQQALDLVSRVFLDPGDIIIVGSPSELIFFNLFSSSSVFIPSESMNTDLISGWNCLKTPRAER